VKSFDSLYIRGGGGTKAHRAMVSHSAGVGRTKLI